MAFDALLMGILEGLTEFLPVSSTGHLLLLGHFLEFSGPPGKIFEVVIQLGAILAICVLYFQKLWSVFINLPHDKNARHFALIILLAFLPAALTGVILHGFIKTVLFNPLVVSIALIIGGILIIIIERQNIKPSYQTIEEVPARIALKIGVIQCLAMIPGVSRSGATILGALCLGVERRTAAEFSFFVAIPTMFGAVAYDLYKNQHNLSINGLEIIAIGFIAAFFSALLIVRWAVAFISRHGFTVFGYYRIILGSLMLFLLLR